MPKTTARGTARQSELPNTLRRSEPKAQRLFAKAHDSALDRYGNEERAHRVAFDALKHSYEKIGDHWEPKPQSGPSDQRAKSGGPNPSGKTAEGVNANATKDHLLQVAGRLSITGRWKMTKNELVSAIEKHNRRASAEKRT